MPDVIALRFLVATVAQLFDLATFSAMVAEHGPQAEANPIILAILRDYGLPAIALAKVVLIVLVGIATVVLSRGGTRRTRVMGGLVLGVAIVAGVFGGWTNALALGGV